MSEEGADYLSGGRDEDPGRLDDALGYMIHRTARLTRYHLLGFFRRHGYDITPEQWFILYRLHGRDRQAQSELTDRAIDDRANITRLIDSLEKRGLVARMKDPKDRRRSLVTLVEPGRQMLTHLLPLVRQEREQLFGRLSKEEERMLRRILGDLQKVVIDKAG